MERCKVHSGYFYVCDKLHNEPHCIYCIDPMAVTEEEADKKADVKEGAGA